MAEDDQPFIRITNREIYDALVDVKGRLTAVESTLGTVLADNVATKRDYGIRLRSLELKVYTLLSGVVTACGLLLKVGFL